MGKINIFRLPNTFEHDHHNHDCQCVKCYFDKLNIAPKIESVWLIEYILLFIIDNTYSNQFVKSYFFNSSNPRSPPIY